MFVVPQSGKKLHIATKYEKKVAEMKMKEDAAFVSEQLRLEFDGLVTFDDFVEEGF